MKKVQSTLFQSWGTKVSSTSKTNLIDGIGDEDIADLDDADLDDETLLAACQEWDSSGTTKNTIVQGTPLEDLPGFDISSGHIWIYPTNMPVRDYQMNIVEQSLLKNTLVTLPTGLGKTFIAAVVMYNFYRWYPSGKIVFMAPTKPLVAQQIEACYNIMGIPQNHTAEMTGSMHPPERKRIWQSRRVFFLTPQVLMNDLSRKACPADDIKCLVVDEAHKALGNHSYCQVVRELSKYTINFRVLALSATPGSDLKAVQQVLTNLMIAHIEIRSEEAPGIQKYVHSRKIDKYVVPLGKELEAIQEKYLRIITMYVDKLYRTKCLYSRNPKSLTKYQVLMCRDAFRKDPPQHMQRAQLGVAEGEFAILISLYHGYELLLQHGMHSLHCFLTSMVDGSKGTSRARNELMQNHGFREIMEELERKFKVETEETELANRSFSPSLVKTPKRPFVYSHPKLKKLEEVVLEHFDQYKSENGCSSGAKMNTRVMIFTQYRDSVNEISTMLNQHKPTIKCMPFVGQSSAGKSTKGVTQKEQLRVVREFRAGGYNTIVSTCVGEEGLDIGEVDLIVCYDVHKSPIRLVQRMGRTGRKRHGRIVMLVTEGKEETVYNQGFYNNKGIQKALHGNTKNLQLYHNNPRMVPKGLNPKIHQMYLTVPSAYKNKNDGKYARSSTNQSKINNQLCHGPKRKNDAFLSEEELKFWNLHYKLDDHQKANVKVIPSGGRFLTIGDKTPKKKQKTLSSEFSLSEWSIWQTKKQPFKFVDHSKRCKHFVEVEEFIEVQGFVEGEDVYGMEMATFLNKDDIIKKRKSRIGIQKFCVNEQLDSNDTSPGDKNSGEKDDRTANDVSKSRSKKGASCLTGNQDKSAPLSDLIHDVNVNQDRGDRTSRNNDFVKDNNESANSSKEDVELQQKSGGKRKRKTKHLTPVQYSDDDDFEFKGDLLKSKANNRHKEKKDMNEGISAINDAMIHKSEKVLVPDVILGKCKSPVVEELDQTLPPYDLSHKEPSPDDQHDNDHHDYHSHDQYDDDKHDDDLSVIFPYSQGRTEKRTLPFADEISANPSLPPTAPKISSLDFLDDIDDLELSRQLSIQPIDDHLKSFDKPFKKLNDICNTSCGKQSNEDTKRERITGRCKVSEGISIIQVNPSKSISDEKSATEIIDKEITEMENYVDSEWDFDWSDIEDEKINLSTETEGTAGEAERSTHQRDKQISCDSFLKIKECVDTSPKTDLFNRIDNKELLEECRTKVCISSKSINKDCLCKEIANSVQGECLKSMGGINTSIDSEQFSSKSVQKRTIPEQKKTSPEHKRILPRQKNTLPEQNKALQEQKTLPEQKITFPEQKRTSSEHNYVDSEWDFDWSDIEDEKINLSTETEGTAGEAERSTHQRDKQISCDSFLKIKECVDTSPKTDLFNRIDNKELLEECRTKVCISSKAINKDCLSKEIANSVQGECLESMGGMNTSIDSEQFSNKSVQKRTIPEQKKTSPEHKRILPGQKNTLPEQNKALQEQKTLPEQKITFPEQKRASSEYKITLTEQKRTLPDQRKTLPEQERTLPEHKRTLTEQKRTWPNQRKTLHEQERTSPEQSQGFSPCLSSENFINNRTVGMQVIEEVYPRLERENQEPEKDENKRTVIDENIETKSDSTYKEFDLQFDLDDFLNDDDDDDYDDDDIIPPTPTRFHNQSGRSQPSQLLLGKITIKSVNQKRQKNIDEFESTNILDSKSSTPKQSQLKDIPSKVPVASAEWSCDTVCTDSCKTSSLSTLQSSTDSTNLRPKSSLTHSKLRLDSKSSTPKQSLLKDIPSKVPVESAEWSCGTVCTDSCKTSSLQSSMDSTNFRPKSSLTHSKLQSGGKGLNFLTASSDAPDAKKPVNCIPQTSMFLDKEENLSIENHKGSDVECKGIKRKSDSFPSWKNDGQKKRKLFTKDLDPTPNDGIVCRNSEDKSDSVTKGPKAQLIGKNYEDDDEIADDSEDEIQTKRRNKKNVLSSPVFKTPIKPAKSSEYIVVSSDSDDDKISSDELPSPLGQRLLKKSSGLSSALLNNFKNDDEDFQDFADVRKKLTTPVHRRRVETNSRNIKHRRDKNPTFDLLDLEADVESGADCSSDEANASQVDQSILDFINDNTVCSQGADLQAIYLQSLRDSDNLKVNNRFRLAPSSNIDDEEIFSQVPQQDEDYGNDSFVVYEENDMKTKEDTNMFDMTINPENIINTKTRRGKHLEHKNIQADIDETTKMKKGKRKRVITYDSSSEEESIMKHQQVVNCTDKVSVGRNENTNGKSSPKRPHPVIDAKQRNIDESLKAFESLSSRNRINTHSNERLICESTGGKTQEQIAREERLKRQREKQLEFRRKMAEKERKPEEAKTSGRILNTHFQPESTKTDKQTSSTCEKDLSVGNDLNLVGINLEQSRNDAAIHGSNHQQTGLTACQKKVATISHMTNESDTLREEYGLSQKSQRCDGQPVVLVDPGILSSCPHIASTLELQHNLNSNVHQLSACDFMVSSRMGVIRRSFSDFANGANRNKLVDQVRHLFQLCDRPCLIVEANRLKKPDEKRNFTRTKYLDRTIAQVIKTHMKLLFTDSTDETASVLADLTRMESRKGFSIQIPKDRTQKQEQIFKICLSIPCLNFAGALCLSKNCSTFAEVVSSTPSQLEVKARISASRAQELHQFFKHKFNTEMLANT